MIKMTNIIRFITNTALYCFSACLVWPVIQISAWSADIFTCPNTKNDTFKCLILYLSLHLNV